MLFNDFLVLFGVENVVAIKIETFPKWIAILILFFAKDFIQFNIHRFLHAFPKLWEFHKVHHSVEEMGFAAHLRFHWMESIIYKSIAYIPMAMLGFDLVDFFYADLIAISIGHFNHSNIKIPLGPFKYLFNNPQMHIWHHAKTIPNQTGVNFGISLSIWDYLFKTNYIPYDGRDVALGFEDVEHYPDKFIDQMKAPFETK
jgi:sterol desaturase/sphingolipid hydroxylase (fatty acid hydroxylase superfamily)